MSRDTTVIQLRQPDAIDDPLSELAREGARRMLGQVLIAEADAFVAMWKDVKWPDGRDRVVRHGHGPERAIQTGIGTVAIRRAKVRDRGKVGAAEKIRFTSSILPKWARREESRCSASDLVLAGHFDRRLPGGPLRSPGQGRAEPVAGGDHAADGGVAGGLRGMAEARSLGAALCLCVGGRGLPAGADGSRRRMHAGADRRDTRGQEGTRRLPDRGARERAELAGAPRRRQAAWARDRA